MDQERAPVLRVVRGNPTAEELAAVLAVVSARAAASPAADPAPRVSGWADRRRLLRSAPRVGPGQWRASAW